MTSHLKLHQRARLMVALALTAVMVCQIGSAAQVTTNVPSSGLGTTLNGSTSVPCVGGTCDITGGNPSKKIKAPDPFSPSSVYHPDGRGCAC